MDTPLPETPLTDDVDNDIDPDELLPDVYVEKATRLIYECRFFDTFVLVRPATPKLYLAIKKLRHDDFINDFEEFGGDRKQVREFIHDAEPDFILC